MRKQPTALVFALAVAGAVAGGAVPAQAEADTAALAAEAKVIIKRFATALQGELQAAMKEGGPTAAIGVCNTKAGPIADQVSVESGWDVARTSHKLRNPDNAPDAFEQRVLDDFLARQAEGAAAEDLVHAEVVESGGTQTFRFLKAIPTAEVCTTCHGTDIAPDIAAELDKLYPEDRAVGFTPGEMRGVFTLKKDL